MTITLQGIGVSKGVAIGKVHIIRYQQLDIRKYTIKKSLLNKEIKRFEDALTDARQQLRAIREHIPASTSVDIKSFIDTHLLMLDDSTLTKEPKKLMKELRCNAEWALKLQRDALVAVFDEMGDAYLRTRRDDVDYVVNRIQRILLKQTPLQHETPDQSLSGYIFIGDDLTPADTVLMQHHGITAFATEFGGPTSHTAILARSLGIPAIVGLQNVLLHVKDDDEIILDGSRGIIVINADKKERLHYQKLQKEYKRYSAELGKLKDKSCITVDGIPITLQANIELPKDFETAVAVGAEGVGLYRTEFLYMNRESPPDEQEHFSAYTAVIEALNGGPLTIRTLDLGADKQVDGGRQNAVVSTNPALGLRAIRLCLKEPALFYPQLRAIIRASAHGIIRMMIPMLSNIQEMRQVLDMVKETQKEFEDLGVAFDRNMEIGGMIEVPAAAVCADIFARELDFLSIGTNDLIQYTMAIDRVNDEVNYLYDPLNPAVLRLIHNVIDVGRQYDINVTMCGEMAGEIKYTELLLGLGLRQFSLHPSNLLEVKKIIMESDIGKLQELADKTLSASDGTEVASIMNH